MSHCEFTRLFHNRPPAAYPIIIRPIGFLTVGDVVAAGFILTLAMPPMSEMGKVRLIFEAEPSVSARDAPAPHRFGGRSRRRGAVDRECGARHEGGFVRQ